MKTMQELEKKFNAMKNEACEWIASWKSIRDNMYPTRGKFEGDEINDGGLVDYKEILDNTTQMLVNYFASGMSSGMTSQARKWFKLEIDNEQLKENQEVKIWLEDAENKIYEIFNKSNVYESLFSMYEEISLFATAALLIEKDFDKVLRLRTFTAGEYYLANDSKGKVNTFAREFSMTVAQIVEEFGYENCSTSVRNMYDTNNLSNLFVVRHLICPNLKRDYSKKDNKNMEFSSYYWEKGSNDNKYLRESGYEIFPILAPRWALTCTSDIYGKDSPAWKSLGDNRMLQHLQKVKSYLLDETVDPPKLMDDSIDVYDFSPGGITRFNSMNPNNVGVRNLEVNKMSISEIYEGINDTRNQISKAFYADLFLMITNQQQAGVTATEIRAKVEEKMLLLAPALMRLNNEAISPLIETTFNFILEFGLLPEPPEELQGIDYKIDYISTIAQAQKMIGTQAIEQMMSFSGNLAAINPTVLDNIDFDIATVQYSEKLGISSKIIRSKEAVAQIRNDRQQQQQQAQMQQTLMNGVQGAKVLSETEIRPNTALTALVGEQ